jgi:hypothetical protein
MQTLHRARVLACWLAGLLACWLAGLLACSGQLESTLISTKTLQMTNPACAVPCSPIFAAMKNPYPVWTAKTYPVNLSVLE